MLLLPQMLLAHHDSLSCCEVHGSVVQKFKGYCLEMTDETGMSLAAAERKKQMVQIARHQA